MKRIFLTLFICLCCAPFARAMDPWAEMEKSVRARIAEETNEPYEYQIKDVTLLPRILEGKPIRIALVIFFQQDNELSEQEFQAWYEQLERSLQSAVTNAYKKWFLMGTFIIEHEQNRQEEFADVLPILKKGVTVEFVEIGPDIPKDVVIFFQPEEKLRESCGEDAKGCMRSIAQKYMVIMTPLPNKMNVLMHEIGHTLGLADTYMKKNASETYRSRQHDDYALMNGDDYLSEDDIDGLINGIDAWTIHTMKKKYPNDWQSHVAPRVLYGWDSLARDDDDIPVGCYRLGTFEE